MNGETKRRFKMKRLATLLLAVLALVFPLQASALCDIGQARVIHAEATPFNNVVPTAMLYWVAPNTWAPSVYYVYTTASQIYINLLNAALISGKQVRVTGNAAICGGAGTLRPAGTVVAVFIDSFN
jgi:hypothetical protein